MLSTLEWVGLTSPTLQPRLQPANAIREPAVKNMMVGIHRFCSAPISLSTHHTQTGRQPAHYRWATVATADTHFHGMADKPGKCPTNSSSKKNS